MPPETGYRFLQAGDEPTSGRAAPAGGPLRHLALLAPGGPDLLRGLADSVLAGITAGQDVLIALPSERAEGLRDVLGSHPPSVVFTDPADIGGNPARIIPTLQSLAGRLSQPAWFVTEPIWKGRSDAEIREVIRHEALVNRALNRSGLSVLCAYDTAALPEQVLADVRQTHPALAIGRKVVPSAAYPGRRPVPARCDRPLDPPPTGSYRLRYRTGLRAIREQVARRAAAAGLSPARVNDLVLAVGEVMANTLRHTVDGGLLRLWLTPGELICQIDDGGRIEDPLAGRMLPDPGGDSGRGLWLVNQCCDLAEVRSGRQGTAIRLHMRRGLASAPAGGSAAGASPAPSRSSGR